MIFDKACTEKRRVHKCEECCRFINCRDDIPYVPKNDRACLQIGYAIIGGVLQEYEKAFKKGNKNACSFYEKWLRGAMPWILSAEKYDGGALLDSMQVKCAKKYGTLDSVYEAKSKKIKAKIALIKNEIEETESEKRKGKLRYRIQKLKGLLNE